MSLGEISFFGAVDRKDHSVEGRITSEYPAWYHKPQIDDMKESIRQKEAALEQGRVPLEEIPNMRQQIEREKNRLAQITDSTPKVNSKQADELSKCYKNLGGEIADRMFTREDMELGVADPHKEVERILTPSITVDPDIAKACGVQMDGKGLVTREGAIKIWKIVGAYLGERTNPEILRRNRISR